jgi:hypothetical protein
MGKNERIWAEIAEKAVAAALRGLVPVDAYIKQIADDIRLKLQQQHPRDDIVDAEWVGGNNYANPGDVHVTLASGIVVKIECKFSHAKGSGTAKNLGQATLTEVIDPSIQSYVESERSLKDQRYALIESLIGRPLDTAVDYENILRAIKAKNKADPILKKMNNITKPGQIAYAKYAADCCNLYLDRVNELVGWMLNLDGTHNVLYCVVKQFETARQTTEFHDYTTIDHKVTKVIGKGKSIHFQNASGKTVLRWSVTWKNICQGGSTPCFNVFVGNAFKP